MIRLKTLIPLLVMSFSVVSSFAQQKEEAEHKLVQFHMALLRKGPKWDFVEPVRSSVLKEHGAYFVSLLNSGRAIIGGPIPGDKELVGIYILRAKSAEEAETWVSEDPAVKGGVFSAEMHPWWSEDIFKKANSSLKMTTVYLGFLKRGPNRKEGDGNTPEVQELQKAHLANINRLAEMKKLVMAGPMGDNGDVRGIFVFRVESRKEAEDLTATDPMIKINRLILELHPWRVPDGVIP